MSDVKALRILNKESLNPRLPPHIKRKQKPRGMPNAFPEMEEYVQFNNSKKWQEVKIKLEESNLKVHSEPLTVLDDICYACFLAEHDKFVEDKIREKYRKAIKNKVIEDQVRALKTLQKFVEKVPEIGNKAFDYALRELKKNGTDISISIGSGSSFLPQLFNQYSEELKKALNYLKSPKSLESGYRGYFGGLVFPSELPHGLDLKNRKNIKKQSLLFHLVFIFRHHTAGEEMPPGTGGYTMPDPDIGKPCYELVTDIAEVFLGKSNDLNEDAVTHSVTRLKKQNVRFYEPSW